MKIRDVNFVEQIYRQTCRQNRQKLFLFFFKYHPKNNQTEEFYHVMAFMDLFQNGGFVIVIGCFFGQTSPAVFV
jgi:hypothetical protein